MGGDERGRNHGIVAVFVHFANVAKGLQRAFDLGGPSTVARPRGLAHVTEAKKARLQDRLAVVIHICARSNEPPRWAAVCVAPGFPMPPRRVLACGAA